MNQTTRPDPPRSARAPRPSRKWRAGLAVLLALPLLLATLAAFLLTTEAGARLAWRTATLLVGGLSGELQQGSLANGIALRNVRYQNPGNTIALDRLDARWQATLRAPSLTVASIDIGSLDITPVPSADKTQAPPDRLWLPFALDLQRASIGLLRLHLAGGTQSFTNMELSASSDQLQHRLVLKQAQSAWGAARGTLDIDGSGPILVEGNASLAAQIAEQGFAVDARVWGPLARLNVQLRGKGEQLSVDAESVVTPFAPLPFVRARVAIDQFDPRQFAPAAPRATLQMRATLEPEQEAGTGEMRLTGPIEVRNSRPGPIDKQLIPVESLQADLLLTTTRQQMNSLQLSLPGGGRISGTATLEGQQGRLQLQAHQVDLRRLYAPLQATALNGPITVEMDGPQQQVEVRLSGKPMSIAARMDVTPQHIVLHEALLQSGPAMLRASGKLGRGPAADITLAGKLTQFDPSRFVDRMQLAAATKAAGAGKRWEIPPGIRINMDFSARGRLQPALEAQLDFALRDSRYNNMPLTGEGKLRVSGNSVLPSQARLDIAGNKLSLDGSFGRPGDQLRFALDAPVLARLGMGASGRLVARGTVVGSIERPAMDAQWDAQQLQFGELRLEQGSGSVRLDGLPGADKAASFRLAMTGSGARAASVVLARLQASAEGTSEDHRLQLAVKGKLRGQPLDLQLAAHGALRQAGPGAGTASGTASALAWQGTLDQLDNREFPRLSLRDPLTLKVSAAQLELGAARMVLEQANIDLAGLLWREGLVRSAGRLQSLNVGHLLALQRELTGKTLPVSSDLVLDGSWDVSLAGQASGSLQLLRTRGDLVLKTTRGDSPMGINRLSLDGTLDGERLRVAAVLDTARLGRLDADGTIGLVQQASLMTLGPQSALELRLRANVARLSNVASLAGPRLALEGRLAADIRAAGTLAAPVLTGEVLGQGLALTLFDQGVRLHDGVARLTLANNMLELQEVLFRGGNGTLRASGRIPLARLAAGNQDLVADIVAERLQLLADPSRQLTVSGKAVAANRGGQLQVTGNFTVDEALFSLPEKSAPSLGSDVVVIDRQTPQQTKGQAVSKVAANARAGPAAPQAPDLLPPRVELDLDLGRNFRFRGSGADLRLGGALTIRSGPGQAAQAFGTVRVIDGTYRAFGAKLLIERGVMTFQGPFGNPVINIVAMRREQEVPAGVQVTGNAQRPRVDLISEPDLAEEEKLSWLVFGRASSSGTGGTGAAQAALQGAALGLLNRTAASRIASDLGLSQVQLGSSEYGTLAGQPVVTLGKEISNRLYIGYEQSLAGIGGVLKLTYELSRHWSVVLFGGAVSGLDLLYSQRFDRWGAAGRRDGRDGRDSRDDGERADSR